MNNGENNIEILYEKYPVLKVINDNNNNIIQEHIFLKILKEGESMSSIGSSCEGIMFVISGIIKIHKVNEEGNEINLYDIKSGELCHEALSCILSFKPLEIMGTALQDSDIFMIPMSIVKKYLLNDVDFLKYMYEDIHNKLSIIMDKREGKIHSSVEERLIKALKNKSGRIIYTTHKELALEIDSGREVVSRKLKKLERDGYIKLGHGKIEIIKDFGL